MSFRPTMNFDFEPHSWYMGFAIKKLPKWQATSIHPFYPIIHLEADTLEEIRQKIRDYWRS